MPDRLRIERTILLRPHKFQGGQEELKENSPRNARSFLCHQYEGRSLAHAPMMILKLSVAVDAHVGMKRGMKPEARSAPPWLRHCSSHQQGSTPSRTEPLTRHESRRRSQFQRCTAITDASSKPTTNKTASVPSHKTASEVLPSTMSRSDSIPKQGMTSIMLNVNEPPNNDAVTHRNVPARKEGLQPKYIKKGDGMLQHPINVPAGEAPGMESRSYPNEGSPSAREPSRTVSVQARFNERPKDDLGDV